MVQLDLIKKKLFRLAVKWEKDWQRVLASESISDELLSCGCQ
jgi:hypothetical protein